MNAISAAYGVAVIANCVRLRRVDGDEYAARLASKVRRSGTTPAAEGGEFSGCIRGLFVDRGWRRPDWTTSRLMVTRVCSLNDKARTRFKSQIFTTFYAVFASPNRPPANLLLTFTRYPDAGAGEPSMDAAEQLAEATRYLGSGLWSRAEQSALLAMRHDPKASLIAGMAVAATGDATRAAPILLQAAGAWPTGDHPCLDLLRLTPSLPR